jgi:hypothetical protein
VIAINVDIIIILWILLKIEGLEPRVQWGQLDVNKIWHKLWSQKFLGFNLLLYETNNFDTNLVKNMLINGNYYIFQENLNLINKKQYIKNFIILLYSKILTCMFVDQQLANNLSNLTGIIKL